MIGNAVNGGVVMATGLTALGEHLAADAGETTAHDRPRRALRLLHDRLAAGAVHGDDRGHADAAASSRRGRSAISQPGRRRRARSSGCAPSAPSAT